MQSDAHEFPVEVVGTIDDAALAVLAELLVDLADAEAIA